MDPVHQRRLQLVEPKLTEWNILKYSIRKEGDFNGN